RARRMSRTRGVASGSGPLSKLSVTSGDARTLRLREPRGGTLRRLLLGPRARVDDRRQLGLELGAKRLHSRRETEAVSEVFELLAELKSRPRGADLHPPSGRHG